ncbi:hypothetical protein Hamer_G016923 [Homarus americanus]|uniref:Uncharacterized protein n=1 Tax=Homarus americanus TaxID=6706 RepID=A0A8J5NAN4_HOMAM|nr:hypothetical protein Hamer_G016923 [Homarus americanus]
MLKDRKDKERIRRIEKGGRDRIERG